jgi:hypothetical protein
VSASKTIATIQSDELLISVFFAMDGILSEKLALCESGNRGWYRDRKRGTICLLIKCSFASTNHRDCLAGLQSGPCRSGSFPARLRASHKLLQRPACRGA